MVTDAAAPMPGGMVEDLDALIIQANVLDAPPAAAPGAPVAAGGTAPADTPQASRETNAAELLIALQLVRDMTLPLLAVLDMPTDKVERLAGVWADPALVRIADAGADVMERHGIVMSDVLGRYGPYISLAAAAAPPTIATIAIVKKPGPSDGQQQPA